MTADPDHAALAEILRRPALDRLLAVLDGAGEEARIVGGAVRNALLSRPVHEVDIATTATPDVTKARARAAGFKAIPTGVEHGTVTVMVDGAPFEVTTLREDVETDGRRAVVRFGRDFSADAQRRDFTLNALSLGRDGCLHAPVGRLPDLAPRRVRFISDPTARIREAYLPILRLLRFHAEYGEGELDRDGLEAAIRECAGLAILSSERIRAELLKLLAARRAAAAVAAMSDAGLLTRLLGGVGEIGRLARAVAQDGAGKPDSVRRLAAFAVMTREDAERLRERLRLSNAEHRRLSVYADLLARLKSLADPLDAATLRRLVAEHGAAVLEDAFATIAGEPRPIVGPEAMAAFRRFACGEEATPVFPLRGADFIAHGVPKGPQVGELLARARARWLDAGCPTDSCARDRLLGQVLAKELA